MIFAAAIIVFLLILFAPLIPLGGDYYRSLLLIYYKDYLETGGGFIRVLPDIPYLRVVKWPNPIWFRYLIDGYARDDRYIYVEGYRIEDSDPHMFRRLATPFSDGRNQEYYYVDGVGVRRGSVRSMKIRSEGETPQNFDIESFEPLGAGFLRDATGVYCLTGGTYPEAYELFPHAKESQIIVIAAKVDIVDPATFQIKEAFRSKCTAIDKNFVYDVLVFWYGGLVKSARDGILKILHAVEATDFRDLWCGYYLTNTGIYFSDKRIPTADKDSFEVIAAVFNKHCYPYAKDKNSVYFKAKVLEGADPQTFQVVATAPDYSFDAQRRYSQGNLISALPESLAASEETNFERAYNDWQEVERSGRSN